MNSTTLNYLSQKSLSPWIADSLFDWTIIAGTLYFATIYTNPLVLVAAIIIVGNRQHALAVLGHDGTHYTLSVNKRLNDFITNIVTLWPIGLTVNGYRKLHFQHHREVGTCNDPELLHKGSRRPQWDLPTTRWKIASFAFLDLFGYSIRDYVLIVRFSKPERSIELLYLFFFHLAAIVPFAALGLWVPIAIWYLSLLSSFMMFFRLRLWLEHQGTPETNRISLNFWQAFLLAPHNSWYHWEHHKWSNIPYSKLPDARKVSGDESALSLNDLLAGFESSRIIGSGESLKEI